MEVEVIWQRQEGSDTVSEAGHDKGFGHFLGVVGLEDFTQGSGTVFQVAPSKVSPSAATINRGSVATS